MSQDTTERVLRTRTITVTMNGTTDTDLARNVTRPYGPAPLFKGHADEDVEDWIRLYERYGTALGWSDENKANNLIFALDDEARRWYSSVLREAPTRPLVTWEEWQKALREDFAGEHVQDWAYIQLQERRQLPGETPRQYVSSILHLCVRANTTMTEGEKVRCLLRGLRPEMMERVAISNPKTTNEFLQHLQRLTHVGTMAQHAMAAMPTHSLPGFVAASPFSPGSNERGRGGALSQYQGHAPQGVNAPEMLTSLQESVRALTSAVEKMSLARPRRFPARQTRNQSGQVICFRCKLPYGNFKMVTLIWSL